jgi:hypothetical protein
MSIRNIVVEHFGTTIPRRCISANRAISDIQVSRPGDDALTETNSSRIRRLVLDTKIGRAHEVPPVLFAD